MPTCKQVVSVALLSLCSLARSSAADNAVSIRADAAARADSRYAEVSRFLIDVAPIDHAWTTKIELSERASYRAIVTVADTCHKPELTFVDVSTGKQLGQSSSAEDFGSAYILTKGPETASLKLILSHCKSVPPVADVRVMALSIRNAADPSLVVLPVHTQQNSDIPESSSGPATVEIPDVQALQNRRNTSSVSIQSRRSRGEIRGGVSNRASQRLNPSGSSQQIAQSAAAFDRTAPILAQGESGSPQTSSFGDHPDEDASRCISFGGPLDIMGERVTNRCNFSVAYAFCVNDVKSSFACHFERRNAAAGSGSLGPGRTLPTGWINVTGEVRNLRMACKVDDHYTVPEIRTLRSGVCLAY